MNTEGVIAIIPHEAVNLIVGDPLRTVKGQLQTVMNLKFNN